MSGTVKKSQAQGPAKKVVNRAPSASVKSTTSKTSANATGNPLMTQVSGAGVSIQARGPSKPNVDQTKDRGAAPSTASGKAGGPDMTQVSGWGVSNPSRPIQPSLATPTSSTAPTQPAISARPGIPTRPAASSALRKATTPPEQPRPSPAVSVLEESTRPPKDSFSWKDLQALLKAAHNPRFCRSRENADEWIKDGGVGDACALIGGFPFVVKATFPSSLGPQYFEAALFGYIESPSAASWKTLEERLGLVANTKEEQAKIDKDRYMVARTGKERGELCKAVYKALYQALENLLDSNRGDDVHMIMIKASKGSSDRDHQNYGPLGKMGNTKVPAQHVSNQLYHGQALSGKGQDKLREQKVQKLVGAVVSMAQKIVSGLNY